MSLSWIGAAPLAGVVVTLILISFVLGVREYPRLSSFYGQPPQRPPLHSPHFTSYCPTQALSQAPGL